MDWGRKLPAVKRYPPRAAVRPADPLPALLRDAYGWTRYQWDDWGQATSLPGMANLALGRPLRAVPSGGGLSSSELYPVGEVPGLPSGAYHYDGAAEALDPVRANVTPADLGLDDTPLALLITSVFGRVSFKYGEFGYRLQCLDAGLLAGQILAVLDAAGLGGRLHTRFHDEAAEERLGLTPTAERPLVAVAVRGLPPRLLRLPGRCRSPPRPCRRSTPGRRRCWTPCRTPVRCARPAGTAPGPALRSRRRSCPAPRGRATPSRSRRRTPTRCGRTRSRWPGASAAAWTAVSASAPSPSPRPPP
ncbi:SagB/ThcOx family dehydrogenase [Thermocatellispora tengchongensis]|uniref:SagB/ThcOx family dehydrogenase n=1 Tax=Thermocatellispora tengchongensis TaxID=1073253 RepID=UPI00362E6BB3